VAGLTPERSAGPRQEPGGNADGWARVWRVLDHPVTARVLIVVYVVAGIYLALGLGRLVGLIDPDLWILLSRLLSEGAGNTFLFSVTIIPIGTGIGFLLGWGRVSRHPLVSWPAAVYVDIVRGLPPLLLILFAYFWLPFILQMRGAFNAGLVFAVLALGIHSGAYQTEIFRAGFNSVARGQVEAAEAIGLTKRQAMRHVILPQTFRVTLPALGNEFANVIKDSSLLAAVGAADLVFWARNVQQFAFQELGWVFVIWIIIALLYFVITYVITQVVSILEQAYRVPGLGSVSF